MGEVKKELEFKGNVLAVVLAVVALAKKGVMAVLGLVVTAPLLLQVLNVTVDKGQNEVTLPTLAAVAFAGFLTLVLAAFEAFFERKLKQVDAEVAKLDK